MVRCMEKPDDEECGVDTGQIDTCMTACPYYGLEDWSQAKIINFVTFS